MIQYVWEAARETRSLGDVVIATGDAHVAQEAEKFGGKVFPTPGVFDSGTDRVAFVARSNASPIIVNLQGDEPLLKPAMIERLVSELREAKGADLATLAVRKKDPIQLSDPNVVKVVLSKNSEALYFSRQALAMNREGEFYKHIGIYAYRRDALLQICQWSPSPLETLERLEQLRALENGMTIKVVLVDNDTIAVDTPEDLARVESEIQQRKGPHEK